MKKGLTETKLADGWRWRWWRFAWRDLSSEEHTVCAVAFVDGHGELNGTEWRRLLRGLFWRSRIGLKSREPWPVHAYYVRKRR